MTSPWTPERVEKCKALYLKGGMFASEIAAELGPPFTKNSVIGKINRHGWNRSPDAPPSKVWGPEEARKLREKNARYREKRKLAAASGAAVAAKPPLPNKWRPKVTTIDAPRLSVIEPIDPGIDMIGPPLRLTIMQLTDKTCKWPYDYDGSTFFCGGKPVEGLPYCPCHCRMAYVAPRTPAQRRADEERAAKMRLIGGGEKAA